MAFALIWPMMAQAFLVYGIYYILLRRRVAAVRGGEASVSDFRVPVSDPPTSAATARCLANQFELPVLFFAVCLASHVTGATSLLTVALAWGFVAARVGHAAVYLTSNRVRHRQRLFTAGLAINLLQWLALAWHLATAS